MSKLMVNNPFAAACIYICVCILIAACGSSGGKSDTGTTDKDVPVASGDTFDDPDGTGESDTAADLPSVKDLPSGNDLPQTEDHVDLDPEDIVPGSKTLGQTCFADIECDTGLCWRTKRGSGCTVECKNHSDCQGFGGLVCVYIRAGITACAPPPPAAAQGQCTSHADCLFPSICIAEFGWCDLPECTYDGDCPNGQKCREGFRECEPVACVSTYECVSPLEYCLDAACGPPQCKERSDCQSGEVCNKVQGICTQASACQEGKCSYYNQICVDGLCEPNLCTNPCSHEGDICNPGTGKCGAACTMDSDCGQNKTCEPSGGVCQDNLPPVAIARVVVGGKTEQAVTVKAGTMLSMDGSASYDPEEGKLEYWWGFSDVAAKASQVEGDVLCNTANCPFIPTVPGLYQLVLVVIDPLGLASTVSQATVYVQP